MVLPKLIVRFCFWVCCDVGVVGLSGNGGPAIWLLNALAVSPLCPLDLGFKGDNAPLLKGNIVVLTPGSLPAPVALRRIGGRAPRFVPGPDVEVSFGRSANAGTGLVSAPIACLLDFSCRFWTERKCVRSSCHFISSRPIFERVDSGPNDLKADLCLDDHPHYKEDTSALTISALYVRIPQSLQHSSDFEVTQMLNFAVATSTIHRGTWRDADIFRVPAAVGGDLERYVSSRR